MFQLTAPSTTITPLSFAASLTTWTPIQFQPAAPPPPLAPPPQVRPSLYQEFAAHQLLQHITTLADDWDGYGAAPIHADTARNAHRALTILLLSLPLPEITPNSNGTVSFEWQSTFGHANLEIGLTRYSFFVKLARGPTIPFDGAAASMPGAIGSVIAALLFPVTGAQLTALTSFAK
jgi:hypothetical protein